MPPGWPASMPSAGYASLFGSVSSMSSVDDGEPRWEDAMPECYEPLPAEGAPAGGDSLQLVQLAPGEAAVGGCWAFRCFGEGVSCEGGDGDGAPPDTPPPCSTGTEAEAAGDWDWEMVGAD